MSIAITTIFVGEPLLDPQLVKHCFKEAGVDINALSHGNAKKGDDVVWCRDHTVVLLDGTHLLGFADFDQEIMQVMALIPRYSERLAGYAKTRWMGEGVYRSLAVTRKITRFLAHNQIPFKNSHCAFDGGNVHLFYDQTKKPRAIVGFNTVIHTYVALKMQKIYDKKQLNFKVEPSKEAYYMARNVQRREKYKEYEYRVFRQSSLPQDCEIEEEYNAALFSPVTSDDKIRFHDQAIEIERQLQIAKEEIAGELGVDELIVVPQRGFHIDMELLPLQGRNVVFYHKDRDPLFTAYVEKVERVLLSHGLIPKPVCGIAEMEGIKFNLMNGLQIEDVILLPKTDPLFDRIDKRFVEALQKEGMKIARIELPRDTITQFDGGLRCFTTHSKAF